MKSQSKLALLGVLFALILLAVPASAQDVARPEGWTEESHGNDADPNYDTVFPQDKVNTVTITIAPEEWQAMMDDMTALAGEFGVGGFPGGFPGDFGGQISLEGAGGQLPPGDAGLFVPGQRPPVGQGGPGGPGGFGGDFFTENPMWVTADITFDGQVWTNVGIRFKGNSSLSSTWRGGIYKLPFKIDFDEFEDDYPEIKNQRFYGFKELSFSSNWSDDSLLREKVTADVFREAGLAASQTAFYAVYVDHGDGPVYFGLYTAVEVVEDTVIETQFADDSGNAYKPEGAAATFAAGTFDEEEFDKQTNEDEADYSDVQALYDILNSTTRTSDPEAWRAELESVFDVDTFLLWLAANTVVQNWDTYGQMSHNFYLYHDPESGLLTWIPWDNNMALSEGMGGGRGGRPGMAGMGGVPGGGSATGSMSFEKSGVTSDWPLVRYLLDVPDYYAAYVAYVDEVSSGAFEPSKMIATYQALHDLIAPYVIGENGEQDGYSNLSSPDAFETALDTLIEHVQQRYAAAQEFVTSQIESQ